MAKVVWKMLYADWKRQDQTSCSITTSNTLCAVLHKGHHAIRALTRTGIMNTPDARPRCSGGKMSATTALPAMGNVEEANCLDLLQVRLLLNEYPDSRKTSHCWCRQRANSRLGLCLINWQQD